MLDAKTTLKCLTLKQSYFGGNIMNKNDVFYTETHEWIKVENDEAIVGITDFAQHELGDIVYIELPEIGDEITKDEAFGTIEAVKALEELVSQISGEIIAVNEELEDSPEIINQSAFEDGWLVRIKLSDKTELDTLLNANEYQKLIEE